MSYKDKDKQKEADRLRQQRRRDKIKAKGVTNQGVTDKGVTSSSTCEATSATQADVPKTLTSLPAYVPEPVSSRYARGELEYVQTIDRLLAHTIDQLKDMKVWIPVWRYTAG